MILKLPNNVFVDTLFSPIGLELGRTASFRADAWVRNSVDLLTAWKGTTNSSIVTWDVMKSKIL